jgi:dsDNA-binding SOS-regulon protein
LVVSVPGADERGASVFERVLDHANAELATMVDQAAITAEERRRMALNVWPRRTSDLVAPFADGGRFRSLTLKVAETHLLSDAAWVAYEKDHDAQALARKHAMFFRAVFAPTLASYLDAVRAGDSGASAAFADRLTSGVKRRLAANPAHINSLVQILVIARGAEQ